MTPTKSRTRFSSANEMTLLSFFLNQNALDEPPSRFIARQILKLGNEPITSANWASVNSVDIPKAACPSRATAAKVLRAGRELSSPRTRSPRSIRKGPHSTAASNGLRCENSPSRTISIPRVDASLNTPVSKCPRRSGDVIAPLMIRSPIGRNAGSK